MVLNETLKHYSLLGLERDEEKCFAAELDPEQARGPRCPNREPPYMITCVARDGTWEPMEDLTHEGGTEVPAGTKVSLPDDAKGRWGHRLAVSSSGPFLIVCREFMVGEGAQDPAECGKI